MDKTLIISQTIWKREYMIQNLIINQRTKKSTVFLGVIAIIIVLAICSAKFNQIIRLNAKTRMKKFINNKQNSEQEKNKKMFSLCQRGGYLDTL